VACGAGRSVSSAFLEAYENPSVVVVIAAYIGIVARGSKAIEREKP
jgi:hypothetical protein